VEEESFGWQTTVYPQRQQSVNRLRPYLQLYELTVDFNDKYKYSLVLSLVSVTLHCWWCSLSSTWWLKTIRSLCSISPIFKTPQLISWFLACVRSILFSISLFRQNTPELSQKSYKSIEQLYKVAYFILGHPVFWGFLPFSYTGDCWRCLSDHLRPNWRISRSSPDLLAGFIGKGTEGSISF